MGAGPSPVLPFSTAPREVDLPVDPPDIDRAESDGSPGAQAGRKSKDRPPMISAALGAGRAIKPVAGSRRIMLNLLRNGATRPTPVAPTGQGVRGPDRKTAVV